MLRSGLGWMLALLLVATPARAEETPAPPIMSMPSLDAGELAAISSLIRVEAGQVQLRLSTSPQLVPLAQEAAAQRSLRRKAGVGLLVGGLAALTVAVVGAPLLFGLGLSASSIGLVVAAAFAALSVFAGIPLVVVGVIKLARMSEAEHRFREVWERLPVQGVRAASPAAAIEPLLVCRF